MALVRAIKKLEDGEKAIVFSEWEDMLQLLSHALKTNGIEHVRCKGSKSISKGLSVFKKDSGSPPSKVASECLPQCVEAGRIDHQYSSLACVWIMTADWYVW